jgi:hypothetical protein
VQQRVQQQTGKSSGMVRILRYASKGLDASLCYAAAVYTFQEMCLPTFGTCRRPQRCSFYCCNCCQLESGSAHVLPSQQHNQQQQQHVTCPELAPVCNTAVADVTSVATAGSDSMPPIC